METVFITIHDLSPDARIKYCSESVEYILGYLPHEVKGKSCWEYFHPDEIPFGKLVHDRGLGLDKAAVFSYCRVKHKDGSWIGCECVFTVVYDVLIASTAIYQRGPKAQKRASDGAHIRRTFSSSPRDSRYHMLSYISDKFSQEPQLHAPEPRAALFLNRFTRTSAIMFATNGVTDILGVEPSQLVGQSFYYCIAQNCLGDAVRCLESAKANDSIAYLRFWFRDPTSTHDQPDLTAQSIIGGDDEDEEGGVPITPDAGTGPSTRLQSPASTAVDKNTPSSIQDSNEQPVEGSLDTNDEDPKRIERSKQDLKSELQSRSPSEAIFDLPSLKHNPSTASTTPDGEEKPSIELEAVISCTSDGLVVVLRRAKPLAAQDMAAADKQFYTDGLFASPWATQPVLPDGLNKSDFMKAISDSERANLSLPSFMNSIRDVAVFAWSLTSINGSLVDHARGQPTGEAQPPGGLPIWDPKADVDPKDEALWNGFANSTHRPVEKVGSVEPTKAANAGDGTEADSSEDEILWRRVPQQPPWRNPKRRAYQDAFENESDGEHNSKDDGLETRASKTHRKL